MSVVADAPTPAVTDSPIPSPGNPVSPADGKSTAPVSPGAPSQESSGEAENKPDELTELAKSVGLPEDSLSTFKDAETARKALKEYLETERETGARYTPERITPETPVQRRDTAPAKPASTDTPPIDSLDLAALGLDDDEPAAKALRAMEQRLTAMAEKYGQLESHVQAQTSQASEAEAAAMVGEAYRVIDSWASPHYGTSQARTMFQEAALNKLAEVAGDLARADRARGRAVSPIGVRLNRARFILEGGASPGPSASQNGRAALSESQSASSSAQDGDFENIGLTGRWSAHPKFRQALAGRR